MRLAGTAGRRAVGAPRRIVQTRQDVPFYLQPLLGGHEQPARVARRLSLRDLDLLMVNAEYRAGRSSIWRIWPWSTTSAAWVAPIRRAVPVP